MVSLAVKRKIKWIQMSINVTDVGLTLDCRITHFYGSCGLLSKHNRDGGRPGLIAPSAPTLSRSLSLSLRGHSDVQTKSVDTRQSRTQISFPSLRRTPLTYETSWGWFALLWDLLMRNDCCVSHGISSTWLLLNMNPFRIILDQISPMAPAVVNRYVPTLL